MAKFQGLSVGFVARLFTKFRGARLTEATEGKNEVRLVKPANQIRGLAAVHTIDFAKSSLECWETLDRGAVFDDNAP
jgi:hypothetical protein